MTLSELSDKHPVPFQLAFTGMQFAIILAYVIWSEDKKEKARGRT